MATVQRIIVTCVLTTVVAVAGELIAPRTETVGGPWIPRGFEAFEPSVRARYVGRQQAIEEDLVDCDRVVEPTVPDHIPSWAGATVEELRVQGFQELIDTNTALPTQAFINGDEIVLKKCSRAALEAVQLFVTPQKSTDSALSNPTKDIYFSCGDSGRKFTIQLRKTLDMGRQGTDTQGTYRLLALDENVILDGGNRLRIMKVLRRASVFVYGVTFRRGRSGNDYARSLEGMPDVGYSGAGILAVQESAVTAYKCRFVRNKVTSLYARWGGGAAIKLETGTYGLVWGCDFEQNDSAVGGAIASSSAVVLQIVNSKFHRNVARGGMDDNGESRPDDKYNNPLKKKRVILVRGGTIRVDSASGSDITTDEHVLVCGSEFTRNRIKFETADLVNKFGYEADDWFYVRGAGAVAALWNAPFNMDDVTDNQHFASVKDCVFKDNYEDIEPEGEYLGRYVFEYMGAGHFKMEDCKFTGSSVNNAVLKVDNSERWINTTVAYGAILKDLRFVDNKGVYNVEIQPGKFSSSCTFLNVAGVPDGSGNCRAQLEAAVDQGGNTSIIEGSNFDLLDGSQATPSLAPTPVPSAFETAEPTPHPDFVRCTNRSGYNKCEGLKESRKCASVDVAHECPMSCGMCEVCVDFNAMVCADAKRLGRCENRLYKENCPASCNECNATPTPSPTPVPTAVPSFTTCKNLLSNKECRTLISGGGCENEAVARDCPLSCRRCEVCVDYHPDVCANVVRLDLCLIYSHAGKCPSACGYCKDQSTTVVTTTPTTVATPTPTTVATPTPTTVATPTPTTVATPTPTTVATPTPTTVATPTPTNPTRTPYPSTTPAPGAQTPGLDFTPCADTRGPMTCAERKAAGNCDKEWAAAECQLTCGKCAICEDFDAEYCRTVAAAGQCTREVAANCPSACGICDPMKSGPTPGPNFTPCADTRGPKDCADRLAAGNCDKAWAAAECQLTCGKCAVCEDFDAEYCSILAAAGPCTREVAAICPSACGYCT